jgi:hypothetical protein
MSWSRWLLKPWWTDATIDYPNRTVNVTVKVKILSLRDYVAPSWFKIVSNPGGALMQQGLSAALGSALDMEPDLFARMRRNVLEGITKHWSRDDMGYGASSYKVHVTPEDSTSDKAIIIVLAKAVQADLPQGIGKRSFNLATFGDGNPTVDLYDPGLEKYYTPAQLDDDMRETGAHELGHSILRAMPGGGVWHSLTHKGTSSAGQVTEASAPTYPTSGDVDVMLYYNSSPNMRTKRFAATRGAPADVEGLVSMSVDPPWLPG